MTTFLFILAWLLCGFAGSYIGWRFIDRRAYDLEILPLILMCIFGGITLMLSVGHFICARVPYEKFFYKVVFERKL